MISGEEAESGAHGVPDESGAGRTRADLLGALAWIVLGVVVAVASWRMDRLENQDINPYTVPGLVPGLLGLATILFGSLMLIRSLRAGGWARSREAGPAASEAPRAYGRIALILILCLGFGGGLVGHGLPFWLASAIYVCVSIFVLQYRGLAADGRIAAGLAQAVVIGLGSGALVTVFFEKIFLVRLP